MRSWLVGGLCSVLFVLGCGDDDGVVADAGGDASIEAGTDAGCTGTDCCAEDSECDDGQYCNGTETCEASRCVDGTTVVCNDSISCTIDACDSTLGMCVSTTVDADDDGHGDATCRDDRGESLGDDCDDSDAMRFPGNAELCDAIDQDCDPLTFGDKDDDGDGSVDDQCCNTDDEGVMRCGFDCDDTDIARHRRQLEFCDLKDNDCDMTVDEDPGVVQWYADDDQDGVGALPIVEETCQLRPLLSLRSTDCDDNDPARRTGLPEFCDGIDNNCNGVVDERLINCATTEVETTKLFNECLNGFSNCEGNTRCEDTVDAFECIACETGFIGNGVTCNDIDECATDNGGCDPMTTCTNNVGAAATCGACPSGYLGDGLTGCRLSSSCKALFEASFALSGAYTIDPDGVGAVEPFQVYCDLVGAGGGWTLIRSSTSGGTNASVEGLPTPATNSHLSPARMMALATISEQVHIRTSGDAADAITSNVGTTPILSMRAGLRMYSGYDANCEYHPMADWTGASNRLYLQYTCCPEVSAYPDGVFHSCNYANGLSWARNYNGWTYGATNSLEMYFR